MRVHIDFPNERPLNPSELNHRWAYQTLHYLQCCEAVRTERSMVDVHIICMVHVCMVDMDQCVPSSAREPKHIHTGKEIERTALSDSRWCDPT